MDFRSSLENTLFFFSPFSTVITVHGLMSSHVRNSFAHESDFDWLNLSLFPSFRPMDVWTFLDRMVLLSQIHHAVKL